MCGEVDAPLLTWEVEGSEDGGLGSRSEVSEHGREAFTQYEVTKRFRPPRLPQSQEATQLSQISEEFEDELIFLRVRPRTGRTHQIRVHMASIGRPLVGDFTYGKRAKTLLPSCPRLFLHCHRVELIDFEDSPFAAIADLPEDLRNALKTLASAEIH